MWMGCCMKAKIIKNNMDIMLELFLMKQSAGVSAYHHLWRERIITALCQVFVISPNRDIAMKDSTRGRVLMHILIEMDMVLMTSIIWLLAQVMQSRRGKTEESTKR